jgi:Uma2 family endonuclease
MVTRATINEPDEYEEDIPTFEHGVICSRLNRYIGNFLDDKNIGVVVDSTPEYRFLQGNKQGRFPDVSFIRQERLPQNWRSYPEIAPDLAIEVTSPTDRDYEVEAKVAEYQKVRVSLVWVVHPFSRTVDIYRLKDGLIRQTIGGNQELDGENVIPGFRLPVSKIFDFPVPASTMQTNNIS